MKKIAITGGSGFVGSAIYRECLKRKDSQIFLFDKTKPDYVLPDNVYWIECDTTDFNLVKKCLNETNPDHIYLIAGVLGTTELNFHPLKAVQNNSVGISTFIEVLLTMEKKPRLFYVTKPNVWENMYTITKENAERIIKLYMKEYAIEGCIHKWFNAYGPGQHTHPIRKAVPYFIINALHNKPLEIWGNGKQTVDLIHIEDIAYLAVEAMNKDVCTNENVVDIGSGVSVTVEDLAKLIIKLTNSSSDIVYKNMRSGEVEETILVADTTGIDNHIVPNYEFKDLEKGMKDTIEYYRNISDEHKESFFTYYNSNQHEKYYSDIRSAQ